MKDCLIFIVILILTTGNVFSREPQSTDYDKGEAIPHIQTGFSEKYNDILNRVTKIQSDVPDAYATAELLNDFAVFLIENDAWFVCKPLVRMAQNLCPADSVILKDFIEITQASLLYLEGDMDAAEAVYYKQYKNFRTRKDLVNESVRLAINLGELNQRKGRKKESLKYFDRAIALADSIGSHYLYAAAAIHAERLEDNTRVQLEMLEKCREAVFEGDCATLIAPTFLALARFHFRQGDYSLAIEEIDKGCGAARKLGEVKYDIEGLELLARIYQRKNDFSMGLTYQQRASELQRSFQNVVEGNASKYNADASELLIWCEDTFFNSEDKHGNGRGYKTIMWIVVATLCIFATYCCISNIRAKNKYRGLQESKADLEQEKEDAYRKMQEMQNVMGKLEIMYEGFGGMLARIRSALKSIKSSDSEVSLKLKDLSSEILQNSLPERKNEFLTIMEEEDARFISRLEEKINGELNTADKKMALFLRHGLSTQEISAMTGVLPKSVNQSRYRLRRTLGLEQDDNLEDFLQSDISSNN